MKILDSDHPVSFSFYYSFTSQFTEKNNAIQRWKNPSIVKIYENGKTEKNFKNKFIYFSIFSADPGKMGIKAFFYQEKLPQSINAMGDVLTKTITATSFFLKKKKKKKKRRRKRKKTEGNSILIPSKK